jgi:uncharacterized integral membrane protein (TIGR00698 family)
MYNFSLNTDDYWPIWIGFLFFIITLVLRITLNIGPSDLKPYGSYSSFEFEIVNVNFLISLVSIISLTFIALIICHNFLKRDFIFWNYVLVFSLTLISKIIGGYLPLKNIGFGTSIWCIIIGCIFRLIHNKVLKGVMSLEFFIKIAIVLLAIDIQEIANVGPKGIVIAWVETTIVLTFVYFIGIYAFAMDKVKSLLVSAGLSICGSSAVMAISDVINAETEDITIVITILSVFTIPFIPTLPIICKSLGFSDIISGSWIGGSIDSTGAVIASANLLNINALHNAVILKMLQNILIGPITLAITAIWYRSINVLTLWNKFPKFVLGFIIVSIVVSFMPSTLPVRQGNIKQDLPLDLFIISEWFSYISFVLIGMDINLRKIHKQFYNKYNMIWLYFIGQTLDTFTTLAVTYLMFGNNF